MSLIYAFIHLFLAVFVSMQTPDETSWEDDLISTWLQTEESTPVQKITSCRVCSFSGDPDPISPSLLTRYWRLKTDTDWNTRQWEIMIPPESLTPSANCIPTVLTLGCHRERRTQGNLLTPAFSDSSTIRESTRSYYSSMEQLHVPFLPLFCWAWCTSTLIPLG